MLMLPFSFDGNCELYVLSNNSFGLIVWSCTSLVLFVTVFRFQLSLSGLGPSFSNDIPVDNVLAWHSNDNFRYIFVCLWFAVHCTLGVLVFKSYWTSR